MQANQVPRGLDTAAAWSWRILVITGAVVAAGFLLVTLRLAILPVVVALLVSTAFVPPARRLRARGWSPALATLAVFLVALLAVVGLGLLIVPPTVDEFSGLGDTLEEGVHDIEDWLVDGPLHLERQQIRDARERATEAAREGFGTHRLVEGAVLVGELFAGLLLTLILTFFFVKDGELMQVTALELVPERRHATARAMGRAAWETLGGYLKGVALLGVLESLVIGLTLFLIGADLVLPVMLITLIGAFFPLVGAVTAGAVAVLVALVTGGPGDALIVLGVAIAIQQADGHILAPFIYGRALSLHPVVILLALTTGAAVGGIIGAFLAVPVAAVVINVIRVLKDPADEGEPQPEGFAPESLKSATSGA